MTATDYVSTAATAKLIRQALKAAFPGVKFSVRTDSYAGGASIDVRWIDGPTTAQVDAVTGQYRGATFDPSIDLKTHVYHQVDGRRVSYGADYIMAQRRYSLAFAHLVAAAEAQRWGQLTPTITTDGYDGSACVDTRGPLVDRFSHDTMGDLVNRALSETAAPLRTALDPSPSPIASCAPLPDTEMRDDPATMPRDDGTPFRPDDRAARLEIAAQRLQDAATAVRRCLDHGDLDGADAPLLALLQDLTHRTLDDAPAGADHATVLLFAKR